jgi:serpin B
LLDLAQRPEQSKKAGKKTPMQLYLANAIWGQREYAFEKNYLDLLAVNYGAGVHLVDFINKPEDTSKQINNWVDQETKGKIKDIVAPSSIDPSTRMILTNAVYFKAAWQEAFVKKLTQDQPFTLLDGSQISVPIMRTEESIPVETYAGDGFIAVALPYKGELADMLIILPDEGKFSTVEDSLNADKYDEIVNGLIQNSVKLYMPKFEFYSNFDLTPILEKMGMTLAFDKDQADFSKITKSEKLYVGNAVHKAYILVNEEGTEAAAVTMFMMQAASLPNEFRIDRPFIFLIRDKPTGTILFIGRVLNPASE